MEPRLESSRLDSIHLSNQMLIAFRASCVFKPMASLHVKGN
jgi:hypothetical protein